MQPKPRPFGKLRPSDGREEIASFSVFETHTRCSAKLNGSGHQGSFLASKPLSCSPHTVTGLNEQEFESRVRQRLKMSLSLACKVKCKSN